MTRVRYVAIIGPTASGKSALALELAQRCGGELINCDSVQAYRGFNIGAAKPSDEERRLVPHHLWDVVDWHQDYDARIYSEQAEAVIDKIASRGHIPILVGGTGLYLRALWREKWHDLPKDEELRQQLNLLTTLEIRDRLLHLDPQRAAVLHPNDRFRLLRALEVVTLLGHPVSALPPQTGDRDRAFVVRVRAERTILRERIARRVQAMLSLGLIEEVQDLLAQGVDPHCKPMQSIGYAEVVDYLRVGGTKEELMEKISIATRQYAKRQETWFKQVKEDLSWAAGEATTSLVDQLKQIFLPPA
jgi:tRNA dimethylallyltransferase